MALIDDNDRHEVYLARLTTGLLNARIYPSLEEAYKAARLILLDAESIKSITVLRRIESSIAREVREIYSRGWQEATEDLVEMAVYEAGWSAQVTGQYLGASLTTPAKKVIESYINRSLMTLQSGSRVQSGTWAQYVQGSVDAAVQQYNGIVAQGYQQGRTIGQITKDIRDSSNGILKQQAEALARTGQSHYTNQAREAMALANSDVIKYRMFSAAFDNRTTLTCRGFANKVWEITDDSYPKLPLHFNERSVYVYGSSKEDFKRGNQAAVGGLETDDARIRYNEKQDRLADRREIAAEDRAAGAEATTPSKVRYRGKKDKDIFKPGPIPANTTQDAWLRNQPEWFQDSALGKTRAQLFRDGGIKIDKFTDMTGKPLTLAELRELDAEAFKRAGL